LLHRIWLTATLAACALLSTAVGSAQEVAPATVPVAAPVAVAPAPAAESTDPALVSPISVPALIEAVPPIEGLPVESPLVETPRDRVVEAWRTAPPTPHSRTMALRRLRLEYGLGDLRAPAEVVLASGVSEEIGEATELARALAPQMPALQWVHVQDLWRGREPGAAVKAFGEMLWDAAHQLPAQLWLLGNGLLLAWVVSLASAFAFMAMLGLKAFSHAAHDLGDVLSGGMPVFARWALLASVALVPIWLGEGLAGLALVCFALAFVYAKGRERSVLVMAATLWVVALHPLAQWASIAATVVELDPITRSTLAVTKGIGSRADVERLEAESADDLAAAHALVYRARRFGMEQLEMEQLDAMAERWPTDPVVLANRANIEMRAGRTKAAVSGFERAAAQIDSPTLLFDLSQAYASLFRMEEYEATLARAQRIGDREVQALSSLSDPKLVADLVFPIEILRDRLRTRGLAEAPTAQLTEWIAPGRLGAGWGATAIAFAAVVLATGLFGGRFDRSSLCTRCGHRICTRCEETVWSDELCEDCHHLFKNPEATDPKLRMARLQALARRESRIQGLIGVGSLLVPGIAGLAMRRPDLALLGIALFAWIAIWVRWPAGVLVDPLWLGSLAPLCFTVLGSIALVAYAAIVVGSLVSSRNR
jgi:hypothetical protein